jgi:hypothetical protein
MARAVRKAKEARVVWATTTQLAGNEMEENFLFAWSGMEEVNSQPRIHFILLVVRQ